MNRTIDYFIDSETDLASFEYYFEEELNIKSVTLKSIMFYVAFVDLKKGILYGVNENGDMRRHIYEGVTRFDLEDICYGMNSLKTADHVKFHCENNYIIIELLEEKIFNLPVIDMSLYPDWVSFSELVGFNGQGTFSVKGKYTSPKSVIDTPPNLFLRSNLVDKQNTFYNNKYSDILYHFAADIEVDSRKLRIYEPLNCTKNVYKRTNHIKFEITDENGKVINLRGKPVKIHLSFEVFPLINAP